MWRSNRIREGTELQLFNSKVKTVLPFACMLESQYAVDKGAIYFYGQVPVEHPGNMVASNINDTTK